MAQTPSTMKMRVGDAAPDFSLPEPGGASAVSRSQFAGKPLLVIFMCNHCPFVIHLREQLAAFAKAYAAKGLAIVGINSNDVANYPDDSPEKMIEEKKLAGYTFPYLFDDDQSVAKAYHAACTPDFFLFDAGHKLAYRGRFDETRPRGGKDAHGADLRAAADAVLAGKPVTIEQIPSMGCNIKWKAD
ncbi:MAG: thioredoxin family protein [Planctomycetota bacterium]